MSLKEALEEAKKDLVLAQEEEQKEAEEESEEEKVEDVIEEKKEEVEKEIEEVKEEVKEEKPDDAAYARMRRETAAAKKRADEAEARLAAKEVAKEETQDSPVELPAELIEVVHDLNMRKAEREFANYEQKVRQNYKDYDTVTAEYVNAVSASVRLANEDMSTLEVGEETKRRILMEAGNYANKKFENPVEELYHKAKRLGFAGKSFQKEEAEEKEIKPDMKEVAVNRKRSAGMAASLGKSEGLTTLRAAADMPMSEWAKLPASEKKRLMYG